MLQLVDTHAHLYSKKFDSDRPEMVRRAIALGVVKMYLPNIDSESIQPMLDLEAAFPENCFAMMGLHPGSVVGATVEQELKIVEKYLSERRWAGVGETGIDLYWPEAKAEFEHQKIAFARQIEWAKELNLPIIIHSREATQVCIDMIRERQDGRSCGIFHCFSGTADEARQIIDLGFYLGIGGSLTYPKSDLGEILRPISLEHLVLETDSPYLPPVPHRGKRNESAFIRLVAEQLSEVKVLPLAEVARVTTANALKIFG